jgi:hypothetical protein
VENLVNKIALILALMIVSPVWADGMNFNFANPAFNGGPGWSDHVLRMETVEQQRLQSKKDAAKAEEEAATAAEAEKLINKFLENVNSRIYATLSKKLVDAMFSDGAGDTGTVTLDGTTVQYAKTDEEITLIITDADGTVTSVTIPIGGFSF